MSEASGPLTVDIVSDVVCPWCFIGKRHLEAALAALPGTTRRRRCAGTRSSSIPTCRPKASSGSAISKRSSAARSAPRRSMRAFARPAQRAGIAFDFDAIVRQPNTREAHRLIAWAQAHGDADALVERLFRAYFLEGRDLTDRDTLVALAAEAGVDPERGAQLARVRAGRPGDRASRSPCARSRHHRRAVLHLRRTGRSVGCASAGGDPGRDQAGAGTCGTGLVWCTG